MNTQPGLRAAGWAKHRAWTGGTYPPPPPGRRDKSQVSPRTWVAHPSSRSHSPCPFLPEPQAPCLTHRFPQGARRSWKLPVWGDVSTDQSRQTSALPTRRCLRSPGPKSLLTALESPTHLSWSQVSLFTQSRTAAENTGCTSSVRVGGLGGWDPRSPPPEPVVLTNSGSATQYCPHSRSNLVS